MAVHTYYQILGVSRTATPEEITNAKNALAKVYHPDANTADGIDTTAQMQLILEAYHVLSNPEKRKKYDRELSGGASRTFKTFDLNKEVKKTNQKEDPLFVTYWNAAAALQEIVTQSSLLLKQEARRESLPIKIMKKLGKLPKHEQRIQAQLNTLSLRALQYMALLKTSEIPMEYWSLDAMNWVLIRWGQNQQEDFLKLFAQYDAFINQNKTTMEKAKMQQQTKLFQGELKKLLNYAI